MRTDRELAVVVDKHVWDSPFISTLDLPFLRKSAIEHCADLHETMEDVGIVPRRDFISVQCQPKRFHV